MKDIKKRPYDYISLPELKWIAKKLGIKKPDVGWSKCCPPNGNMPAIIKALEKQDQEARPRRESPY